MRSIKQTILAGLNLLVASVTLGAAVPVAFKEDFSKATVDAVPDSFLVLEGGFAVKAEGENKFLELPGAPLDTFGVLFGPTATDDVAVSARIHGTGKGRRFPAFGLGLNGNGGFRLQVSPAKKMLELFRGDESVANVPFEWQSGTWTHLKLQIKKAGDGVWQVSGKAWAEKATEPTEWLVKFEEKTKPNEGRASIWGNPFAGTPIRYDDLALSPAK